MKSLLFSSIFVLFISFSFAQINTADSTFQVIGYWDMNESYTYIIYNEKYKIVDTDTTSREYDRCEVDIKIIDSTANSYTINWHYRDYEIETDNEVMRRLSSIFEDISIVIKTNELGVFLEVVNWEDIKNFILIGTALLKEEYKSIPNMDVLISQIESAYQSKEAIETNVIEEIHQFYFFHGLRYKLWEEYESQRHVPNILGGEQLTANVVYWLDEINPENNNSILRMHQEVDSLQLTNATFEYLTNQSKTLGIPLPERESFPTLTNEIRRASRIHGSGWVIYSIDTKEVKAENTKQVEERIIELK